MKDLHLQLAKIGVPAKFRKREVHHEYQALPCSASCIVLTDSQIDDIIIEKLDINLKKFATFVPALSSDRERQCLLIQSVKDNSNFPEKNNHQMNGDDLMNHVIDERTVRLLGYGLSSCFLLIHIAMLFLFRFYGVTPMAYFNIFSIGFYLLTILMIKKENICLYTVTVYLEVVLHMSLAVCCVGSDSGFQVTLIGMSALVFYAEYMSGHLKGPKVPGLLLCSIGMLLYLGSYAYSQFVPAKYVLPHIVCFWLQIAWGLIVFTVSIFFLKLFVIMTTRSERSFHVVQTLAEAIDAKDTYTNGHSGRVAKYSQEIAKRAGLSKRYQNEIFMMGLLHDVGKIGVPDAVINKSGRLTDEEFGIIKTHPTTGARILDKIEEMPELAVGAHWHHERIDGKGYPSGLKGRQIPIEARIIAVADAYDAMTSNRSYREVMPQSKVREQIEQGLGTQFDPVFGRIMLEMIDEDTDYSMREK